jgi:extracellular factor (EF) 3-hydroxypalmitic acid methyl ester biosynthesis protein
VSNSAPKSPSDGNSDSGGPTSKPVFRYRQRRVSVPSELEGIILFTLSDGQKVEGKLVDVSSFGAKIQSTGELYSAPNSQLHVKIQISQQIIFEGSCRLITEVQKDNSTFYGIALLDGQVDMDLIDAIVAETETILKLTGSTSTFSIAQKIKLEFKGLVADLNTLYQDLRLRLNEEEKHIAASAQSDNHKKRLEQHAISLAISLYGKDFNELYAQFDQVVRDFSPEEHILHKRYFRANFTSIIEGVPFAHRAYNKPLGYAGDYGLMVMLYEYQDIGDTLFEKFHHRAACNQPSAIANKNRVELLAQIMQLAYSQKNSPYFQVTSLACGPGREFHILLEDTVFQPDSKVKFILVDQEAQALEYASSDLRRLAQKKCDLDLTVLQEDVVLGTIKKKPFTKEFVNSDLIISAGLFDYLSNRVAAKLVETLLNFLAPDGELIIGNVSDKNPDRFSMDYFMEWNLILRSPEQLLQLVPEPIRKDPGYKCEVTSESLGLNLFLRIKKLAK